MDAAFEDLSDELHCEIFRLVILQPRPKPYTQSTSLTKLSRLREVCTTWRDLIDGNPHLWSFLHSDDLHHVTKRALRRSIGATLHITCVERGSDLRSDWSSRYWYMSVPDPESHATTFLELVMPQMPRWREATFVNVDWESMKDLQRNPAPRLQRLVLDTDEDTPSPLILFGGMAPLLKHVVCMGAPLRWDSAVLSGLLSLNIRLDNRFKVSPNNLVQLLANSPQMVSLRLCQEGRNDVRVPTGTPTMHLPCLNKIDLQLPSLFAESILKVIQAPVCENFALLTKRGSTTTLQTTIPFLQSCVAANLNRRPGGLRMRFSLSDGLFQCWVAHDGEDDGVHHFYEASFENVDAMKLFDWAAGELLAATTEKIPITLAFNFGFQFDTPLRRIFKKVPRTTKVIIQGAGLPEVLWLILALPFERLRPNTPLRWPLPRMREMVVYGQRYDWGCLLEMVTRRYEKGGLQTPSRIQLINSDADDDIVEDIEDIIGPGRITQDTDWESEFDSDLLEEWV